MADTDDRDVEQTANEANEQGPQEADLEALQTDVQADAQADEEQEKLDYTVEMKDTGPWKKMVTITIPRVQVDKSLDEQYKELRGTALVPGFRKGRAPRRLIEKRFGDEVDDQVKLRLLAQAFEQMEKDYDFEVLGEPDFDPEDVELPHEGDLKVVYEIEVKPEFELPSLEGVRIEKPVYETTPERIEEAVDQLRRRAGHVDDVSDQPAQEGDWITGDITMMVAGVEGQEGQELKEDAAVHVGPTAVMGVWIEDLSKVLVGCKAGQEKSFEGTVPDTHEKEAYHGKKASFTLKVKGLRRLVLAELDEAFFASFGVDSQEDLRREIAEDLERRADREVRQLMAEQVYRYLDTSVTFDLPAGVAARHAHRYLARRYYELLQQGVPNEQIEENLEKLKAASSEEAHQQLKMSFVMEKIADTLDISVGEPEVNGVIARIAMRYGRRPERVRDEMAKEGRLESLREQIRDEHAVDKVLEMADIVDAPPPSEQPKEPKAKKTPSRKPPAKKKEDQQKDA